MAANMADRGGRILPVNTIYPYDTPRGREIQCPLDMTESVEVNLDDLRSVIGGDIDSGKIESALSGMGVPGHHSRPRQRPGAACALQGRHPPSRGPHRGRYRGRRLRQLRARNAPGFHRGQGGARGGPLRPHPRPDGGLRVPGTLFAHSLLAHRPDRAHARRGRRNCRDLQPDVRKLQRGPQRPAARVAPGGGGPAEKPSIPTASSKWARSPFLRRTTSMEPVPRSELAALEAHAEANLSGVQSHLEALAYYLGFEYSLTPLEHPTFLTGSGRARFAWTGRATASSEKSIPKSWKTGAFPYRSARSRSALLSPGNNPECD